MKELLKKYLQNFPILNKAELELLVSESNVQRFPKGTILLKEGQVAKNCYLVLQGCVREYIIKNNEEKSTGFFLEGDSVTPFSSMHGKQVASRYLQCIEDCILTISDESLEKEMCRLIPRLETIILEEVAKISGKLQDDLANFMTSNPEERYKTLLETKPELFQRVPQHQIASYIGITPESLSRIRKRMIEK